MDQADAFQWMEAVQVRNAYYQAVAEVDAEAGAIQSTNRPET